MRAVYNLKISQKTYCCTAKVVELAPLDFIPHFNIMCHVRCDPVDVSVTGTCGLPIHQASETCAKAKGMCSSLRQCVCFIKVRQFSQLTGRLICVFILVAVYYHNIKLL